MTKIWGYLTAAGTICIAIAALGLNGHQCSELCGPATDPVIVAAIALGIVAALVGIIAASFLIILLACCEDTTPIRIVAIACYFVACVLAVASGIMYPIYAFEANLVEGAMIIGLILHVQCALAGFYCIFS